MVELQELITRGRFIFSRAPKRLEVFKLIDGRRSAKDIAREMGRSLNSVLNDLKKMEDLGLIEPKKDKNGEIVKKDGSKVYQKVPILKHVPLTYFQDQTKITKVEKELNKKQKSKRRSKLRIPSDREILDICKYGESQIYEFKAPGTDIEKITKEIAAFLHTKNGGLLFYGVDDDGSIIGSDIRLQDFDQRLQNSVRNTISPPPTIEIKERDVLGQKILVVLIPPWDKKTIYQYTKDGRYYIRKGTNIFRVTPEEMRKLGKGVYVV